MYSVGVTVYIQGDYNVNTAILWPLGIFLAQKIVMLKCELYVWFLTKIKHCFLMGFLRENILFWWVGRLCDRVTVILGAKVLNLT